LSHAEQLLFLDKMFLDKSEKNVDPNHQNQPTLLHIFLSLYNNRLNH